MVAVVVTTLGLTAVALVALGVWTNTWWTIAAGVGAGAATLWVATKPPDRGRNEERKSG